MRARGSFSHIVVFIRTNIKVYIGCVTPRRGTPGEVAGVSHLVTRRHGDRTVLAAESHLLRVVCSLRIGTVPRTRRPGRIEAVEVTWRARTIRFRLGR